MNTSTVSSLVSRFHLYTAEPGFSFAQFYYPAKSLNTSKPARDPCLDIPAPNMAVAMEATVRLLLKTTATGPRRAITLRLNSNTTSLRPREDTMLLNSRPTANLRSLRAITPPRTHPNRNIIKATVIAQVSKLDCVGREGGATLFVFLVY